MGEHSIGDLLVSRGLREDVNVTLNVVGCNMANLGTGMVADANSCWYPSEEEWRRGIIGWGDN